jgi:hypothetical protein
MTVERAYFPVLLPPDFPVLVPLYFVVLVRLYPYISLRPSIAFAIVNSSV